MPDSKASAVMGPSGLIGLVSIKPDSEAPSGHVRVTLTDGTDVFIPQSGLQRQKDGSYFIALSDDEHISKSLTVHTEETIVPVVAEELVVATRQVATGGVRVHKTVQQHEEVIAMPLLKEHVDIRRVIVGRDVEGPMPIRREGEVTIIPLVEEVIVVEKRMRLKEELHITRRTTEEHSEQTVTLQRETAFVERLDGEGRATPEEIPAQPVADVVRPKARPLRRNRVIPEE